MNWIAGFKQKTTLNNSNYTSLGTKSQMSDVNVFLSIHYKNRYLGKDTEAKENVKILQQFRTV